MDPIKQKQIQELQTQITAIKAKGNPTDKDKLAKLEAELAKLISPKGNDAGDMGLRVQRAQKAASEYCDYRIEEEAPNMFTNKDLCLKDTAQRLVDCENALDKYGKKDTIEENCRKAHARIFRPTENEKKAAEEFCKETSNDSPSCIKTEAQDIAICRDANMDKYHTSQEIAENKCIHESKDNIKRINEKNSEDIKRIFEKEFKKQLKEELKKSFPREFSPDGKDHSHLNI